MTVLVVNITGGWAYSRKKGRLGGNLIAARSAATAISRLHPSGYDTWLLQKLLLCGSRMCLWSFQAWRFSTSG